MPTIPYLPRTITGDTPFRYHSIFYPFLLMAW
jgi:hypothetical protein